MDLYFCMCPLTLMSSFLSLDIHECVEYGNVCSNGGTCRNLMGGYICTCPIGWTGDNCTIGEKSDYFCLFLIRYMKI